VVALRPAAEDAKKMLEVVEGPMRPGRPGRSDLRERRRECAGGGSVKIGRCAAVRAAD